MARQDSQSEQGCKQLKPLMHGIRSYLVTSVGVQPGLLTHLWLVATATAGMAELEHVVDDHVPDAELEREAGIFSITTIV